MAEDMPENWSRLILILNELEIAGWHVWVEVTDRGLLLAQIRSPEVDILLPLGPT